MTGGIASGKSTVAKRMRTLGAVVIDADQIARDVVQPGQPALVQIAEQFGEHLLLDDGSLNRSALGALVFQDEHQRATLESILHPRIASASMMQIVRAQAESAEPIVYDAALLVENGRHRDFAALIVVACSPETQRERLMLRDRLSHREAQQRLDSQLPLEDKVALADYVIDNDGTLAELYERVDALVSTLRNRRSVDE
jgi:dephospho-CoA kinase